jgi:capsule polysaccharide export protein KpsC/LpsZ
MVFAVVTPGLWRTPGLRRFFREGVAFRPRQHVDAVLGWGDKPSSIKARAWPRAAALAIPVCGGRLAFHSSGTEQTGSFAGGR